MQDLTLRLRQVMQDPLQTEANFQAILVEARSSPTKPAHTKRKFGLVPTAVFE
jgi:hypothetical protein